MQLETFLQFWGQVSIRHLRHEGGDYRVTKLIRGPMSPKGPQWISFTATTISSALALMHDELTTRACKILMIESEKYEE